MEQNKKLRRVINYLILEGKVKNIAEFADAVRQNRSGVSDKLNGRRPLTESFVLRVVQAFPEISAEYLLYEEGEQMFKREDTIEQKIDKLISMMELLIKKF